MSKYESQTPCVWMQERIDAYLDGDLSPTEVAVADLHLARCLSCAEELRLARQVAGSLRSLPARQCPESVPAAICSPSGLHDIR